MPEEPTPPPVQEQSAYPRPPVSGPPPTKYEDLADKVGFVPNVRLSDNLIQFIGVAVGASFGGLMCSLSNWPVANQAATDAGIGAIGGLLLGTFITGFYLMIKNRKR